MMYLSDEVLMGKVPRADITINPVHCETCNRLMDTERPYCPTCNPVFGQRREVCRISDTDWQRMYDAIGEFVVHGEKIYGVSLSIHGATRQPVHVAAVHPSRQMAEKKLRLAVGHSRLFASSWEVKKLPPETAVPTPKDTFVSNTLDALVEALEKLCIEACQIMEYTPMIPDSAVPTKRVVARIDEIFANDRSRMLPAYMLKSLQDGAFYLRLKTEQKRTNNAVRRRIVEIGVAADRNTARSMKELTQFAALDEPGIKLPHWFGRLVYGDRGSHWTQSMMAVLGGGERRITPPELNEMRVVLHFLGAKMRPGLTYERMVYECVKEIWEEIDG